MEILPTSTQIQPRKHPKSHMLSNKLVHQRPSISSPIGPVKNSRGPDFTRSETLIIVERIKDCSSSSSSSGEPLPRGKEATAKKTRRLSASFQNNDGSLVSSPTTSGSKVNAMTKCEVPQQPSMYTPLQTISNPKIRLPLSSTLSNIPRLQTKGVQDENRPPVAFDGSSSVVSVSTAATKSKLPKSRTMSVLHDLKATISRPSLTTARSIRSRDFDSFSSRKTSNSSTTSFFPQSSSKIRLPRPSLTSLAQSSTSSSPELPSPLHIATAQPSAYWSGRFMALHDRFAAEALLSDSECTLMTASTELYVQKASTPDHPKAKSNSDRPTHLSHSTTTSALTNTPLTSYSSSSTNEDARCRRAFLYLETLCTTIEAKNSLHDWQQSYARRNGRPDLLPQGGSIEGRGIMSRIFGTGARKNDRRSVSALKEASNLRGRKKALAENGVTGHKKRLSIHETYDHKAKSQRSVQGQSWVAIGRAI